MSIFTHLFSRRTETRSYAEDMLSGLYMIGDYGDINLPVSAETAMQAASVYACVSKIARDLSTLPVHVIDQINGGKVYDHPVARLLRTPNQYMTAASFWESYVMNLLLQGNGYAHIAHDGLDPVEMLPLMARSTAAKRTQGILYYVSMLTGQTVPMPADDVAHTPYMAVDGITGRSPIATSPKTIGTAIALADFAARYFTQGSHLSNNAFELPPMSPEAMKETRRLLQTEYGGTANQHKMLAMPGLKVHSLTHSLRENQAIEARDFQLREVCRLFSVPVGIIDPEKSKYAGLEAQYGDYAQSCLRPVAVKIEQEFTRKLFTTSDQARFRIEFNLDAVIRATIMDRMTADSTGMNAGLLTPNEARAHHNLPPVAGGDVLRAPLNMAPVGQPAPTPLIDERSIMLVRSIATSIATKEMNAARKAAKKPAEFRAWADAFFVEHRAHLMERLPIIDAATANAMADTARDVMIAAMTAGTLDATLDNWATTRPDAIAKNIETLPRRIAA